MSITIVNGLLRCYTGIHILYVPQYYTIAVGKVNAPKLANFMEIDVYVLVACPENSLLDSQVII